MAQKRGKHRNSKEAAAGKYAAGVSKGASKHAGSSATSNSADVSARTNRHNGTFFERVTDAFAPIGVVSLGLCLALALIISFGQGTLWADTAQLRAANYAEGVDPEDYEFIDTITGGEDTDQIDMVSSYVAYSQSDNKARIANMELAVKALDGFLLKSGSKLSFNDVVGAITKNTGYSDAPISGSEGSSSVIGGGVSQVASALYVAALRAGLTVEEREAHSDVVDFVPLGQDATIYDANLVLKNGTGRDVYIRASVDGQSVEVKIYVSKNDSGKSTIAEGTTFEVVTEITEASDVPASSEVDNLAAHGLTANDMLKRYEVSTYLVEYISGMEKSCTLISEDSYLAFPSAEVTSK